jgi:peptide/nickel transport system ATP-binding protein
MAASQAAASPAASEARAEPLLAIRNLRVVFTGRDGATNVAVDRLDLDLPRGGSLAVVGESGSGKTVSMRSLLRLLPPSATVTGRASFAGKDLIGLPDDELRAVRGSGIGMVFQNAMEAFNPTLTLKRQLTEHLLWHGICGRKDAIRRAIEVLDRVGIPEPHRRIKMYPFQLSGGMRQRAMIAMAIIADPILLIADEPTTAVDVTLQRQVLDLLADLRRDGLSMIMITHDLGVAKYSCDDVIVMRHGAVVETGSMKDFAESARAPYSIQLLDAALDIETDAAGGMTAPDATAGDEKRPNASTSGAARTTETGDPDHKPAGLLIQARDLVKVFHGTGGDVRAVDGVSVSIARGETIGVVGESGSGKSTLARLLLRLVEPSAGALEFGGRDVLGASGRELRDMRRQVQMVFQNPYGSLLPHLTIAANVAEPLRVHKVGSPKQRRAVALELLERVGIERSRADHYPRQFSGGQQQRVAIARALALQPSLLVCDEPTSALDVSIQAQILDLLGDLKHSLNLSMLFVTHNLAVAQRLCDRIIVMARGHIVEAAPASTIFTRPVHPYTRALMAAVLPVRGEPLAWDPDARVDVTAGELVQVAPEHWARLMSEPPIPAGRDAADASPGAPGNPAEIKEAP